MASKHKRIRESAMNRAVAQQRFRELRLAEQTLDSQKVDAPNVTNDYERIKKRIDRAKWEYDLHTAAIATEIGSDSAFDIDQAAAKALSRRPSAHKEILARAAAINEGDRSTLDAKPIPDNLQHKVDLLQKYTGAKVEPEKALSRLHLMLLGADRLIDLIEQTRAKRKLEPRSTSFSYSVDAMYFQRRNKAIGVGAGVEALSAGGISAGIVGLTTAAMLPGFSIASLAVGGVAAVVGAVSAHGIITDPGEANEQHSFRMTVYAMRDQIAKQNRVSIHGEKKSLLNPVRYIGEITDVELDSLLDSVLLARHEAAVELTGRGNPNMEAAIKTSANFCIRAEVRGQNNELYQPGPRTSYYDFI